MSAERCQDIIKVKILLRSDVFKISRHHKYILNYNFQINNLFCYFPELLPSTNRVAGMGLINFFAALGCMVAPFIVMVRKNKG